MMLVRCLVVAAAALALCGARAVQPTNSNIAQALEDTQELVRVLDKFGHVDDRTWGPQVKSIIADVQAKLQGELGSKGGHETADKGDHTARARDVLSMVGAKKARDTTNRHATHGSKARQDARLEDIPIHGKGHGEAKHGALAPRAPSHHGKASGKDKAKKAVGRQLDALFGNVDLEEVDERVDHVRRAARPAMQGVHDLLARPISLERSVGGDAEVEQDLQAALERVKRKTRAVMVDMRKLDADKEDIANLVSSHQ